MSITALNARLEGSAAMFSELVHLDWDGPCILMKGRSGDYVANGHMTPAFALDLYLRLGVLLQRPSAELHLLQAAKPPQPELAAPAPAPSKGKGKGKGKGKS